MKKFLLPAAVLFMMAITACTKNSAIEGTKPTDSTGTNPGGGNGGTVIGKDSVVVFSDVKFGIAPGNESYGRVFSYKTGLVYPDSNIPDSVGKYINLAFQYQASFAMFFSSAVKSEFDITIPAATKTIVRNYVPETTFAASSFDTLTHASTIKKQTVTDDGNTFDAADLPVIIFFKNNDGRMGMIKVKSLLTEYMVADVKIVY
jgi:hypothetical protein